MRLVRLVTGNRLAVAGVLAAVGLLAVTPDLSGAQLGGLLRRKIAEAAKGEEPKKEAATEAADSAAFNDPNVVEITDAVLVALENSLRAEIRMRAEFRKELAAMKTQEQYDACAREANTSPEGQKITMRMFENPDVTPEQMLKVMEQGDKEMEAFILKRCGPDVRQFNESWRAKRLEEIQAKAAASAGSPR